MEEDDQLIICSLVELIVDFILDIFKLSEFFILKISLACCFTEIGSCEVESLAVSENCLQRLVLFDCE